MLDVSGKGVDQLTTAELKMVVQNVNVLHSTEHLVSSAKTKLLNELFESPDFRYIDTLQMLQRFHVDQIQNARARQKDQLKRFIRASDNFVRLWNFLNAEIQTAKNDRHEKINRICGGCDHYQVRNLVNSIERKLTLSEAHRPAGDLRQVLRSYLTDHIDNELLANIFVSTRYTGQASEHNTFCRIPDKEAVVERKQRVGEINSIYLKTGELEMDNNPYIDFLTSFQQKLDDAVRLPDNACSNCQAKTVGLKVNLVGDQHLCTLCGRQGSKRFRKFGPQNHMVPGDQPPELQGLSLAEVAAISLRLPVVSVYRQGQGNRMKGHSVSFPQDIVPLVDELPRFPRDLNLIHIKSPGTSTKILHVRKQRILEAINWLIRHNPGYAEVRISQEALAAYPEDGEIEVRGYTLPESAIVEPDAGPVEEDGDDQAEDEPTEPFFSESVQLATSNVGAMQEELVTRQIAMQMRGATSENPLDWHEQGPMSSEREPYFWERAFPTLFCRGEASYSTARPIFVSREEWLQQLMWHKSGRFASNTTFVFFAFAFVQKEKAWSLGNLYARKNFFATKSDLEEVLNTDDPGEVRELVSMVTKSSAKMPGTNAYMKTYANYCQSNINFYRHHAKDSENYNVFFTLSAADLHWNNFFKIFPEGRAHLAKIAVKGEMDIPQGADRSLYVTASEDFLWRKRFLVQKAHHFDVFFRLQLELLIKEVLMPVMGVVDHIIRYEFQSRGAIHAHILLVVPMGITEADRRLAWSNMALPSDTFIEDEHIRAMAEAGGQFDFQDDTPPNVVMARIRMKLLVEFVLGCGVSERHPSNDPNDWYIQDQGSLATAPSSECLRQTWPETLANPKQALINLTNKVATHTCSLRYCQKPERHTVNVNGVESVEETPRDCRFGYPRPLVGFTQEFNQDGSELVGMTATEAPRADGWIGRGENGWPLLRTRRNHARTTSVNPFLLLFLKANMDLQYIPTLTHLLRYVSKYLSKKETNSRAADNFAKEALEGMAPHDEVRKLFQRILMKCTQEHDYSLSEVHFYINRENAIQFSRELVMLPLLNDRALDFQGPDDRPVMRKSLGERYDSRHENPTFQALVREFEEAEARDNLQNCRLSKHPQQISLYEYCSMFKPTWEPLQRFKVVHCLPAFKERPDQRSQPEWHKKFLVVMIRAHVVPDVPTLETLEAMTTEELRNLGNRFFRSDIAPVWAAELWEGENPLNNNTEDVFPLIAPDDQAQEEEEDNQVIGDGLAGDLDEVPAEEDNDPVAELIDAENASSDYDKSEDKLSMAANWDHGTAARFRADVKLAAYDNAANPAALRHDQLNAKQALLAEYLVRGTRRLIQGEEDSQFFLEVCGSAGTGKTTALLRYLEDVEELLQDHQTLSVGKVLLFSAATGTAAKLLPKPNATLHSALHLPISLARNTALNPLPEATLRTVQDRLHQLKVLLIDEKSFIGCRFLHNVHLRLQQVMDNYNLPFGGVSVVLIGDFKQLSPVNDLPLWSLPERLQMSPYQRMGLQQIYQENFKDVIVLEENMRQANDPTFQQIIQKVLADPSGPADERFGVAEWEKLAIRSMPNLPAEEQEVFNRDAVYLCSVKKDFMPHNINHIRALNNPRLLLSAINEPASGQRFGSNTAGGLPQHVLLTRGMRVMLTANTDLSNGLSNGSIGTIIGIIFVNASDEMPEVLVRFDTYAGESCLPEVPSVYPIGPISRTWTEGKATYKRTMVPLVAAYGFSIHKSQGQTLGKVILNLGSREFAAGLTYTALTRARCLQDMAFLPMPTLARLENVLKSKTFRTQLADDNKKKGMEEEMLERNPDFSA